MNRRHATAILLAIVSGALLPACELTPKDIREWQSFKDGDRRIAAVVVDPSRTLMIRATALEVLAQSGSVVVLADALQKAPKEDRSKLTKAILPGLLTMMDGSEQEQVHAKDALFYIGGYLQGDDRETAAKAILGWAMVDFSGRYARGRTTLDQVLPALGEGSVEALLALLASGEAIPEVTDILVRMESNRARDEGAKTLMNLLKKGGAEAPKESWYALERFVTPLLVPFVVSKLADPEFPDELKDIYFDHVVKCGGVAAVAGLAGLMADHKLRWIAAEHLLELDDVAGLQRALTSLPASDSEYESEDLFLEINFFCKNAVPRLKADKARVEEALVAGLSSPSALSAATTAHCLGLHGRAGSLEALKATPDQGRVVPAWKDERAVKLGDIVTTAAEAIESRGG